MFLYWFSSTPPALSMTHQRLWGVIAFVCIIAAMLIQRFVARRIAQTFVRRPWTRIVKALAVNGILLWVLLFFRYEGVPFFGARFWLLLLGIGDIVWIVAIVRSFVKVPKQKRAWEEEQTRRRYLR
ncbi:hypothetical protein HY634_01500 [Candidatus Uhrbacteria bacterium]|nr:hypothetical protein [Candidatus Uhrbacteria bacterium]